jgi:hypothetical protein
MEHVEGGMVRQPSLGGLATCRAAVIEIEDQVRVMFGLTSTLTQVRLDQDIDGGRRNPTNRILLDPDLNGDLFVRNLRRPDPTTPTPR